MNNELIWFAAHTRAGQALPMRARLDRLGVEYFIPVRETIKIKGGRRVSAEEPIAGNLVFLHTDKPTALALANGYGLPLWYIIDTVKRTLLEVPNKQMDDFRRVLDCDPSVECLTEYKFSKGQMVRITKGDLSGVEGFVVREKGNMYLLIQVMSFLTAKVEVRKDMVESINL